MALDNDATMTDDQIINDFNDLFGTDDSDTDDSTDDSVDDTTDDDVTDDGDDDDSTDDSGDDTTDDDDDSSSDEPPVDDNADKQRRQQNYAFAEMRNKLKAQENMLKNLGKAIGMDDKSSPEDVSKAVEEILLTKQSKETGVPLDILQRLQVLEQRDAEFTQHERQTKTQNALADLIEKYQMTKDDSDTFVQQLIDSGRNPMEVDGVDLESEYIKHNFQTLLQKAKDDAVNQERERNKKATDKSSTQGDGSPDDGGGDGKINSVKELDKLFNSMSL